MNNGLGSIAPVLVVAVAHSPITQPLPPFRQVFLESSSLSQVSSTSWLSDSPWGRSPWWWCRGAGSWRRPTAHAPPRSSLRTWGRGRGSWPRRPGRSPPASWRTAGPSGGPPSTADRILNWITTGRETVNKYYLHFGIDKTINDRLKSNLIWCKQWTYWNWNLKHKISNVESIHNLYCYGNTRKWN